MQAFTAAANTSGGKYLTDCTLYVTLEPCVMCAGASSWIQIDRIVYGADDEKRGFTLLKESVLHPRTTVTRGVLRKECRFLLKEFFSKKRK
jgi:tRNA(adenine34) deaminase